ncbi:MAG TPA: NAD(P)H dehydrogenase, partial [Flavobacteriaceae bacterium]|nr:NAD(P)H dehydrogenase [Flavobacteriaceae bacterium]
MKKIVVINGHPDKESFNSAIAQTYITSAISLGAEVRYITIGELDFNPNLQFGYRKRMELEPDLVKALEDLHWSEHQVWIHPMWWLGMPAIMKGFFDRVFLPSIAFKINKNGQSEGLL